jgi:hypothetical protein
MEQPAPPAAPRVRRAAWVRRPVRLWVAGVIGVVLLLGGGLGGYFIGAANDHPNRPGFSRFGDRGPGPRGVPPQWNNGRGPFYR